MSAEAPGWFSVRCVFASGWPPDAAGRTYEERVTIWRAESFEQAIGLAEAEAREYAATIPDSPDAYLGLAQAYKLTEEPGHGVEVFSLMRTSDLRHDAYLNAFFDTGAEREEPAGPDS